MADNQSDFPRPDDEVTVEDPVQAREDPPAQGGAAAETAKKQDHDYSESMETGQVVEVRLNENAGGGFLDQSVPAVTQLKDHFTLMNPTTTIRYRRHTSAARIIEDADKQYILEETDRPVDPKGESGETVHEITIRQLQDSSEGVRFLRFTYALATAFWTCFLFIFAVQILLFVFLDLAIQFGIAGDKDTAWLPGFGVLLSIPMFVNGLVGLLVIAGVYVVVRRDCALPLILHAGVDVVVVRVFSSSVFYYDYYNYRTLFGVTR